MVRQVIGGSHLSQICYEHCKHQCSLSPGSAALDSPLKGPDLLEIGARAASYDS